jgi:hypothetical protein
MTTKGGFIADAVAELIAIEEALAMTPGGARPEALGLITADAFEVRRRDRVAHVVTLVASRRLMRDLEDIETAIYRTQGEP